MNLTLLMLVYCRWGAIEAAANAIESMNVHELKVAVPVLLQARDLTDAMAGRRPRFSK